MLYLVTMHVLSEPQVLEDKGNLAYLQLKMAVPVLETFVARSPFEYQLWAERHWNKTEGTTTGIS